MNRRKETEEKIVSFLKEKIKEVQDAGNVIETMYCSSFLYSYIRNIKEHFEEATIRQICGEGFFGKFLSINIVATSYAKGRVVLSTNKHVKENLKPMPPQYSYSSRQAYQDAHRTLVKEHNSRDRDRVDEGKILELKESDILKIDNKIDDKIDEWHNGDSDVPLHEFLGMTFGEYAKWVELKEEK